MKYSLFFKIFVFAWLFVCSFSSNLMAGKSPLSLQFPLTTMEGNTLSPDMVEQKITMLVFWANWCVPCRKEVPLLNALHQEFSKDVLFVGINEDEDLKGGLAFIRRYHLQYPSIKDTNFEIASRMGVQSLPIVLVVSTDGQELYRSVEPPSKHELQQLLAEKK
ncbi:MAG: TlpA family protein disulfide reductase [SAR324 cluster bacterium]|nr:TlpA family protein disulfide reductase [SAR324 cluster bacterium]